MSDDDNEVALPTGSSCKSYKIGHNTHWVQSLRSTRETVVLRVSVIAHADGLIQIRRDGLTTDLWNHTPDTIQKSMMPGEPENTVVWWKPQWHILSFSAHGGGNFSLAELEHRTPCVQEADRTTLAAEATVLDLARRDLRDLGGCTVPLNSLLSAVDAKATNAEFANRFLSEFGLEG